MLKNIFMDYKNKPSDYYNKIRQEMLAFLPSNVNKALDVGCGNGAFASEIKERTNAEVWGIELMEEEGKQAEKVLDKVFIGKGEDFIAQLPDNYFDVIYFNDVLEHMIDPYSVLKQIKQKLTPTGVVISSIPNIRYHKEFVKMLVLNKEWKYQDQGIMDFTHMRFFTKKSIERMYKDAGYKIIKHQGINKTKSVMPYIYNIPFLFTQGDIFYLQYATVAGKND